MRAPTPKVHACGRDLSRGVCELSAGADLDHAAGEHSIRPGVAWLSPLSRRHTARWAAVLIEADSGQWSSHTDPNRNIA